MNTTNETNFISSWKRAENSIQAITTSFILPIILVSVLVTYISCIVILCIKIKNRRQKLKQINFNVRLSFEREEKLKWEVYNENTFIVKEIYLIAICISECCYITMTNAFYPSLILERITLISKVGVEGVIQQIPEEISCQYYNFIIIMTGKGIQSLVLHWNFLIIHALMRYLTDRYLLRKRNKQFPLVGYGVVASLIIILFYNKYTYHFRIIVDLIFLIDWFILVRCGRKLSLVLIGRVREIQQCYGNGITYRNEYNNYLSFRVFNIFFCSGTLLLILGMLSRSAIGMVFTEGFFCNIQVISVHLHKIQSIEVTFTILQWITKLITPIGIIIFYAPAFVYIFSLMIRFCVARCRKQKNFHDDMIRPLIDRYHDRLMH